MLSIMHPKKGTQLNKMISCIELAIPKPKAATLAKAENIGRGNTSPIQYFDEVEFTSYVGIISKAAGPAYSKCA